VYCFNADNNTVFTALDTVFYSIKALGCVIAVLLTLILLRFLAMKILKKH